MAFELRSEIENKSNAQFARTLGPVFLDLTKIDHSLTCVAVQKRSSSVVVDSIT